MGTEPIHSLESLLAGFDAGNAEYVVGFTKSAAVMRVPLSLTERQMVDHVLSKLVGCADYSLPDVKAWFDLLVVRLCRFLATRMNASSVNGAFSYLNRPKDGEELPTEWRLQQDLYDFLASAGYANLEQTHVASGRADIYIPYERFRFVIEVKRTVERRWSCFRSRLHLKQASAYGSTDVRLGVLATLDLSVRDPGVPHISECLGVVRRRISRKDKRGVVFMRVPGNRQAPSSASKGKPRSKNAKH